MNSDQKIKVVFAVNDFTVAGVQRLYLDIFRHFSVPEYELHLLTLFEFPDKKDFFNSLPVGIIVHRFNFKNFRDIREWIRLGRFLRKLQPSVILSSLFFCNTIIRVLKVVCGYKVIAIEHNTYIAKTFLQKVTDFLLSFITYKIVAVSTTVANFTSKQEKISRKKFVVIHNGINIEKISEEADKLTNKYEVRKKFLGFGLADVVAISVGRLTSQKNQAALVQAFADVGRNRPNLKLIILGEGTQRSNLERLISTLGVSDRVFLLGVKENVIPYYRASDFFVSSSAIEGFGIAHAEALCCGLPLLSTKTAGPDEMIEEGRNGFFIRDGSVGAITEGLKKMLADDYVAMGRNARASVLRFSIQETVRKYGDIISACLNQK